MEFGENELHIQEIYYSIVSCSMWYEVVGNKTSLSWRTESSLVLRYAMKKREGLTFLFPSCDNIIQWSLAETLVAKGLPPLVAKVSKIHVISKYCDFISF